MVKLANRVGLKIVEGKAQGLLKLFDNKVAAVRLQTYQFVANNLPSPAMLPSVMAMASQKILTEIAAPQFEAASHLFKCGWAHLPAEQQALLRDRFLAFLDILANTD